MSFTAMVPGVALANGAGLAVETVTYYHDAGCTGGGNLSGSDPNGAGFISEMLYENVNSYYVQTYWEDGDVWDSDFLDPDLAGNASYDDTDNFDPPGAAISFFAGHGLAMVGNGQQIGQTCFGEADCLSPPSGTTVGVSGYGTCVQTPTSWAKYGTNVGVCYYTPSPNYFGPQIIVCGSQVNNANYAALNRNMAFGENAFCGDWRGAAENGDTIPGCTTQQRFPVDLFFQAASGELYLVG